MFKYFINYHTWNKMIISANYVEVDEETYCKNDILKINEPEVIVTKELTEVDLIGIKDFPKNKEDREKIPLLAKSVRFYVEP